MKKSYLIFLLPLLMIACQSKPGSVSGVVTYYFNQYQGDKPDVGAKVYITQHNLDTINDFLDAYRAKKFIEEIDYYKAELENLKKRKNPNQLHKLNIESYEFKLNTAQTSLNFLDKNAINIAKDSVIYKKYESESTSKVINISVDNSTYKATVDGAGNYKIEAIPAGEYYVIIKSKGRTDMNVLEISGKIKTSRITVNSQQVTTVDANFSI